MLRVPSLSNCWIFATICALSLNINVLPAIFNAKGLKPDSILAIDLSRPAGMPCLFSAALIRVMSCVLVNLLSSNAGFLFSAIEGRGFWPANAAFMLTAGIKNRAKIRLALIILRFKANRDIIGW